MNARRIYGSDLTGNQRAAVVACLSDIVRKDETGTLSDLTGDEYKSLHVALSILTDSPIDRPMLKLSSLELK